MHISGGAYNALTQRIDISSARPLEADELPEAFKNIKLPDTDAAPFQLSSKDITPTVVFEGRNEIWLIPQSEKTDRMQAILGRLSETEGKSLISNELLQDDDFLDFAEKLDDADLRNFAKTAAALDTRPQYSNFNSFTKSSSATELFESLQEMDAATVSRVLSKTSELSAGVPVKESDFTYDAMGRIPVGSSAANDLHSFVRAINSIEPDEKTSKTNEFMDLLGSYAEDQEADLIQIASEDIDAAVRIMTQLQNYKKDTQDSAFSYLAELTASINPFALAPPETAPNDSLGEDEWHGSILGAHSQSSSVVLGMLDEFVSLTEDYLLSDKQIETMATKLTTLDNENQRTYLAITSNGLDSLLGAESSKAKTAHTHDDVFAVIDKLRNDSEVRTLISESGRGEKRISSYDGRAYYAEKGRSDSEKDEKQAIDLLVSDAWLNRNNSFETAKLTHGLRSLEADQRDQLIDKLHNLTSDAKPLHRLNGEAQQEEYAELIERLSVIHNTSSLSDLLNAEAIVAESHETAFWDAAHFLGEHADALVTAVNQSNTEGAQLLVGLTVSTADAVEQEEMGREAAKREAEKNLGIRDAC